MFKKKGWVPYGAKAKYLHIGVEDNFKQTITRLKLERGKDKDNQRKLKKIRDYGFNLELKKENEPNKKKWLDKDMDW